MVEVIWERSEGSEGLVLDPVVPLVTSVANVVCALCFGKRNDYNDTDFLTIVHINNEVLRIFAAGILAYFFPVFRYLPSPSLRKMVEHIKRMWNTTSRSTCRHLKRYEPHLGHAN